MLDELKRAFEQAQRQSEEAQRELAQRIQGWLAEEQEEREWDAILSSPAGQETLERLAAEARKEMVQGKTRDLRDIL
jgi:hypothetical protein